MPEGRDPDRRRHRVDQRRRSRPTAGRSGRAASIGARYANVGMICITSRIGDRIAASRSLRPAAMPSGMPIRSAIDDRGERGPERVHGSGPTGRGRRWTRSRGPTAARAATPPKSRPRAATRPIDARPAERQEDLVEQVDERGHADPEPSRGSGCRGCRAIQSRTPLSPRKSRRRRRAAGSTGRGTGRTRRPTARPRATSRARLELAGLREGRLAASGIAVTPRHRRRSLRGRGPGRRRRRAARRR